MTSSTGFGKLILFGSGETSPTGKKIHRKILQTFRHKQKISILETPAGFQPNSRLVAEEIGNMFLYSHKEFVSSIDIIPARKKQTFYSPDDQNILTPLKTADYIFLGPGSPTYALSQLKNTKALNMLIDRWQHGTTLCFSSAAAIAAGEYVLPVYEIYKAGLELHWKKGLNILKNLGFPISVVTHWNNKEGGNNLDTRYCYMGEDRFDKLLSLLPKDKTILGIDEHTAIVFEFKDKVFSVEGVGNVTLLKGEKEAVFSSGNYYSLDSLYNLTTQSVLPPHKLVIRKLSQEKPVAKETLPKDLQDLLKKRDKARKNKDFAKSDEIRKVFESKGYKMEDSEAGQKVYQHKNAIS